jgi:hypothetical protein
MGEREEREETERRFLFPPFSSVNRKNIKKALDTNKTRFFFLCLSLSFHIIYNFSLKGSRVCWI